MAVEMIIDQWNSGQRRYRTETFCYGPLSCPFYQSGPTRKVPSRKRMSYTEENWVTWTRLHTVAPTTRLVEARSAFDSVQNFV